MSVKIGLFDDHPVILDGVQSHLQKLHLCEVIFRADNKHDFYAFPDFDSLDIIVCDVVGQDIVGFELFEWLQQQYPKLPVVVYSSLNSPLLIDHLIQRGVKGYVNKVMPFSALENAIKEVLNNKLSFPTEFQHLLSAYRTDQIEPLTDREVEILIMIAGEHTSSEIASKLFLSISTVENHRKNIFKKLGVKNVAGLILIANQIGYLK